MDTVLSTLLPGRKFLTQLNERITIINSHSDFKIRKNHFFNMKDFNELFEARHSIIHSIKHNKRISVTKLKKFINHSKFFLFESKIIVMLTILEEMKKDGEITTKHYQKDIQFWENIEMERVNYIYLSLKKDHGNF